MRFWVDHIFFSKNIDQVFITAGCGNINQSITIEIANSHSLWMLIYRVENRRVSKSRSAQVRTSPRTHRSLVLRLELEAGDGAGLEGGTAEAGVVRLNTFCRPAI